AAQSARHGRRASELAPPAGGPGRGAAAGSGRRGAAGRAAEGAAALMSVPRATMRLQLHAAFTFADVAALAPYVAALGISHVYVSPITTARRGSMHGYDVINPTLVNPELGGEEGFR